MTTLCKLSSPAILKCLDTRRELSALGACNSPCALSAWCSTRPQSLLEPSMFHTMRRACVWAAAVPVCRCRPLSAVSKCLRVHGAPRRTQPDRPTALPMHLDLDLGYAGLPHLCHLLQTSTRAVCWLSCCSAAARRLAAVSDQIQTLITHWSSGREYQKPVHCSAVLLQLPCGCDAIMDYWHLHGSGSLRSHAQSLLSAKVLLCGRCCQACVQLSKCSPQKPTNAAAER